MIEVLKEALADAKRNERHNNVAETRYWLNQYKLIAEQAIAELESQEPVAWVDLQREAQQIVESKVLWKKFIDGTPLVNDISCWMVDFALQLTHPPQRSESSGKPSAWVGLTKEDKDLIEDLCEMMIGDAAFSTIDAILKGKNT